VLMHQDDIAALGTQAGHTVDILSAQGCMSGVTVFAFDVPRGNVLAYYPEANILTSTEHDPRSQTPAFKSVPVRIIPR
jgi:anaerobic selenocysteine-containing dehydrogenase